MVSLNGDGRVRLVGVAGSKKVNLDLSFALNSSFANQVSSNWTKIGEFIIMEGGRGVGWYRGGWGSWIKKKL